MKSNFNANFNEMFYKKLQNIDFVPLSLKLALPP